MIIIPDKLFLWNYFWYKMQDPGTSIACYSWHESQLHSGLGLGLGVLENPGTYYCSRRWRRDQMDILLHALLHCCAPKQWTAGHSKEIPLHCLGESGDRQIWTKADRPPYSALNGHLPQLLISDSRGFSHQIRFLENLWRPGRSHQQVSALLCTIRF